MTTAILAIISGCLFAFCLFLIAVIVSVNKALHCERNDHNATRRALRKALMEIDGSFIQNYNRVSQ